MRRVRRILPFIASGALAAAASLAGAAGVAQAAAPPASPALNMFTTQLPIPPEIDARTGGSIALDEVVGTHQFGTLAGTTTPLGPTPSYGYWPSTIPVSAADTLLKGPYLGPTIEARRDAPIAVSVTNKLAVPAPPGYVYPTPPPNTGSNAACIAARLEIINPLANFFDPTIDGTSGIDKCAPGTAVHLHGAHTAQASDGGPMDVFHAAGINTHDFAGGSGTVTYQYGNDQEAAGLWYHDHALANTRFNPMSGLAGLYLLRDRYDTGDASNAFGLPYNSTFTDLGTDGSGVVRLPVNPREIPIVLQDRQFNADGTYSYPTQNTCPTATPPFPSWCHPVWAPESFNDVSVVNGTAWPNLNVDRAVYRIRMVNGSNARFYKLQLVDAKTGNFAPVPIYQIGAEGGLFNAPVSLTALPNGQLLIPPGERADLLMDFRNVTPAKYVWTNTASAPFPKGKNNLLKIMQFTATGNTATNPGTIPTTLRVAGNQMQAPTPARSTSCWTQQQNPATQTGNCTRTVFLNEVHNAAGMPTEVLLNNRNFAVPAPGGATSTPTGFTMNLNPAQWTAAPKVNTFEEWDIVNTTVDAHPIHLHSTQFRVINRQNVDTVGYLALVNPSLPNCAGVVTVCGGTGVTNNGGNPFPPDPTPFLKNTPQPPDANEANAWKDTVTAYPGQVVRILVPFGGTTALGAGQSAFTGDASNTFTGDFVWHCHILEHEENDMMQGFTIRP
jgi:FtsP/CotA-like multicopper oxidase with cupredoxin domain